MYCIVCRKNSVSQKFSYERGQKEEEGSHRGNYPTRTGIGEIAKCRVIAVEAGWFHDTCCLLHTLPYIEK
jgi:Tfp pilus tip-associated adhesin PilY1